MGAVSVEPFSGRQDPAVAAEGGQLGGRASLGGLFLDQTDQNEGGPSACEKGVVVQCDKVQGVLGGQNVGESGTVPVHAVDVAGVELGISAQGAPHENLTVAPGYILGRAGGGNVEGETGVAVGDLVHQWDVEEDGVGGHEGTGGDPVDFGNIAH